MEKVSHICCVHHFCQESMATAMAVAIAASLAESIQYQSSKNFGPVHPFIQCVLFDITHNPSCNSHSVHAAVHPA